jgi:glycine/D-amino acid oxidase-like deaminating enzyme
MRRDILIVGQGLAGTWLAWECERAGISFVISDAGQRESSASRVAAGIVNPITGQRLVKSWRIDSLLPAARAAYRELEGALETELWRRMRLRRIFRDDRERRIFGEKRVRGDLAPFAGEADEAGFWVEEAARVDVVALLDSAAARWKAQGHWLDGPMSLAAAEARADLVIDCRGFATTREVAWARVPWEYSRGEILELTIEGLDPDVILNRGHWLLPVGPGLAWVGATHDPGVTTATTTAEARATLSVSAAELLDGRAFEVARQFSGVRVNLPDKQPVAGRHPSTARLGVLNGLGAKGVWLAPMLARQWVNHLTAGVPFDVEVDVARFNPR